MEDYSKLYKIVDKKRKKLMNLFVSQNIKYICEYKTILSNYNLGLIKVYDGNSNVFYDSNSYREIKESMDIINLCTDYMVGKDKYQMIEIYGYLKGMQELGYEILDIYKSFCENYLKEYDKTLKKNYENIIIDLFNKEQIKGMESSYVDIEVDVDVKKLKIDNTIIKFMRDDIFKI